MKLREWEITKITWNLFMLYVVPFGIYIYIFLSLDEFMWVKTLMGTERF